MTLTTSSLSSRSSPVPLLYRGTGNSCFSMNSHPRELMGNSRNSYPILPEKARELMRELKAHIGAPSRRPQKTTSSPKRELKKITRQAEKTVRPLSPSRPRHAHARPGPRPARPSDDQSAVLPIWRGRLCLILCLPGHPRDPFHFRPAEAQTAAYQRLVALSRPWPRERPRGPGDKGTGPGLSAPGERLGLRGKSLRPAPRPKVFGKFQVNIDD